MYKIVMLGDGGVGKSCLTIQLCRNYFAIEYDPTIENSYRTTVRIDEDSALLDILDTAGQEEYIAMRDQHIQRGRGFVLVYSITNPLTFRSLPNLYQSILTVKEEESYPVVVMGNKADLEKDRKVSTQEGIDFAKKIEAPFYETSAKTRLNVEDAFFNLVREMKTWHGSHDDPEENKKKSKKPCIII